MPTNKYSVVWKKRIGKYIGTLPDIEGEAFVQLVRDLEEKGPVRTEWKNYSKLGKNKHHCHLSHRWVACWYGKKREIEIEVYYVGSREDAPY